MHPVNVINSGIRFNANLDTGGREGLSMGLTSRGGNYQACHTCRALC